MRILAPIVLVLASLFPGATGTQAACAPDVGPGIAPPNATPTKLPGFHAAWYGQSGYMRLCPGGTAQATLAYYNSGSFGWVASRRGEGAYFGTWATSARPRSGHCNRNGVPLALVFTHLLISAGNDKVTFWLDPSLEVAPFGVIARPAKGCVFLLEREFYAMNSTGHEWQTISPHLPFASFQRVQVNANLTAEGSLEAKVHYSMRGENELLLRITFHQSPREKWKEVAQLLALSDGFRGKVTSVTASDPYATKEPFSVEYEITQPKFVDWAKKSVRIPA